MTANTLSTVLTGLGGALLVTALLGQFVGMSRRTCRKLWIAADIAGLLMNAVPEPHPISMGVWAVLLALDVRRLLRGDDDDDDRPPRRRKRLKLRLPDLSGLVLPGALRPVRGAA